MDWAAIASTLAETSEPPLVLLDNEGRIRIFNRAMEQALGWPRSQVEGQLWATVCTPPDLHDDARRWMSEALRGALHNYVAVGLTDGGQRLSLHFEFSLVGRGTAQGLLATATEVTALSQPTGAVKAEDFEYEVRTGTRFGQLVRFAVNGEWRQVSHLDMTCFTAVHNADGPCEQCPLREAGAPWPRTTVRYRCETGERMFEVKIAEELGGDRVRVRRTLLPEQALDAIHAAKVEDLSRRASLSSREQEVLSYLLLGRTAADIATAIGIAVRTAKYYQAAVLGKLGADSRADLLRLLF